MIGYFVEIKLKDWLIFAADVPSLDCIRIPGSAHEVPRPVEWKADGPRAWRGEYPAVIGDKLGEIEIHVFQLTARRHT